MIARPRLVALVDEQVTESVILVVAPPGYGKTTLVREALGGTTHRWVTLAPDATLETLVRALIEALVPDSVPALGGLFERANDGDFIEQLAAWLQARLRPIEGLVVVDDLHRLRDKTALDLLANVIVETRARIRWIVASRESSVLPIGSWIAYGWMGLPITEADLAFSSEEAQDLARTLGIEIGSDDLGAIVDDTRGWPVAVRVSLDAWKRSPVRERIRIQTREVLFAHVEREIWSELDDEQRELLAVFALLGSPANDLIADAGFPHSAAELETLHALVPFVQRDGKGGFHLHDLFAEFAIEVMRRDDSAVRELSRQSGANLRAHRHFLEALQLFVRARLVSEIHDTLVVGGFDLLDRGYRELILTSIELMESAGQGRAATVTALRGLMAVHDGDPASADALLERALRRAPRAMRFEVIRRLADLRMNRGHPQEALDLLESIQEKTLSPAERAEWAATQAAGFASVANLDQANRWRQAAENLLDDIDVRTRTKVLQRLGLASYYLGDLPAAVAFATESAMIAEQHGMAANAAFAYAVLFAVANMTGETEGKALGFARRQESAAERAGNVALRVHALRCILELAAERGDDKEFEATRALLNTLPDSRNHRDPVNGRLATALYEAGRGGYRRACAALEGVAALDPTQRDQALCDAHLALYRILDGHTKEAGDLLARPLVYEAAAVQDLHTDRMMAIAGAVRGVCLWALERRGQAQRSFAFDFNRLQLRDRLFAGELQKLTALPRPLATDHELRAITLRLGDIGFGGYGRLFERLAEVGADIALSPAELQTLIAFDSGGRVEDVAILLGKSPNTVRNQIKSAIKKIGCSGRHEALAYARRRGWLNRPGIVGDPAG